MRRGPTSTRLPADGGPAGARDFGRRNDRDGRFTGDKLVTNTVGRFNSDLQLFHLDLHFVGSLGSLSRLLLTGSRSCTSGSSRTLSNLHAGPLDHISGRLERTQQLDLRARFGRSLTLPVS